MAMHRHLSAETYSLTIPPRHLLVVQTGKLALGLTGSVENPDYTTILPLYTAEMEQLIPHDLTRFPEDPVVLQPDDRVLVGRRTGYQDDIPSPIDWGLVVFKKQNIDYVRSQSLADYALRCGIQADRSLSRLHAHIAVEKGGKVHVTDLDSKNKTCVTLRPATVEDYLG